MNHMQRKPVVWLLVCLRQSSESWGIARHNGMGFPLVIEEGDQFLRRFYSSFPPRQLSRCRNEFSLLLISGNIALVYKWEEAPEPRRYGSSSDLILACDLWPSIDDQARAGIRLSLRPRPVGFVLSLDDLRRYGPPSARSSCFTAFRRPKNVTGAASAATR
jgi:hypothetical protein